MPVWSTKIYLYYKKLFYQEKITEMFVIIFKSTSKSLAILTVN